MGVNQTIWLHSDIIVSHSLYPDFGRTLSEISNRDYPNRNYITKTIEVLDMDSYEAFKGGNNDCTVDAVLGICNERHGVPCRPRHLLVELRMGYTNVNNLSPSQIRQKDCHSRDLLNACIDHTPIDSSLCLLFDQSIIHQAERWLYRTQMEHQYAKTWIVFSPSTFCNYINADKEFPHTPKQETIDIGNRFAETITTQNLEILNNEFQCSNYSADTLGRLVLRIGQE